MWGLSGQFEFERMMFLSRQVNISVLGGQPWDMESLPNSIDREFLVHSRAVRMMMMI
jgi:hypothetical protein